MPHTQAFHTLGHIYIYKYTQSQKRMVNLTCPIRGTTNTNTKYHLGNLIFS